MPPAPAALAASAGAGVQRWMAAIFELRPTPLLPLPTLAAQLGVAAVHVKDEGARLGLRSFKALGGAYAVTRLVHARALGLGLPVRPDDLPRSASGTLDLAEGREAPARRPGASAFRQAARGMTFACATDGNHGQSVAAGARLVGARSVIFVHQGVSQLRRDAIARFGADVREVAGSYDDAVAHALAQAEGNGWNLLSDTSWPGYEEVPMIVMQGYTLITHELGGQLERPPTHVFLQAGVGGFAAALAVSMADLWREAPPRFVVVEPDRAACLMESARQGRRVRIGAREETLMSMLECYEPSLCAWQLLQPLASAFMAVADTQAVEAMRTLALDLPARETVQAGESGAAGLAGLMAACRDAAARRALGLNAGSRVLLINTESATDAARYLELVGVTPSDVARRAAGRGADAPPPAPDPAAVGAVVSAGNRPPG